MSRTVYLDHQAATPVLPEVFARMQPFFAEQFGNPSSLHQQGLRARDALAKAREQLAALIRASSPDEIIFTTGGTEAANLAIKGVAYSNRKRGNHIVLTEVEHPAVMQSVEWLETQGFAATRVPVDGQGRVDPEAVRAALREETILIAVQHANHEIGTIQPVRVISEIAAERGIAFFVDATASAGWLPVDVQALGATLLSLSARGFYGPRGAGVLYRHRRERLAPLLHGGEQEGKRRAGSEDIPAIVGAGVAAEIAMRELTARQAVTARLQRRLWDGLECRVPYTRLNGPPPGEERLPVNVNFSVEFVEGEALVLAADMAGIALASGSACLSKALKVSPVLAAIGLARSLARGSVLATLGQENTDEEMDHAVHVLAGLVAKLRGMSPSWDDFEHGRIDSVILSRM